MFTGSRYIYDLYYEKEAISKKLYDWLLKNGYADASLIAKWKKQGYEKVSCWNFALEDLPWQIPSCAVYDVFRQKRQTSTVHAYVEFPKIN